MLISACDPMPQPILEVRQRPDTAAATSIWSTCTRFSAPTTSDRQSSCSAIRGRVSFFVSCLWGCGYGLSLGLRVWFVSRLSLSLSPAPPRPAAPRGSRPRHHHPQTPCRDTAVKCDQPGVCLQRWETSLVASCYRPTRRSPQSYGERESLCNFNSFAELKTVFRSFSPEKIS